MNTEEQAYNVRLLKRISNLEKNQIHLMTLLDRVQKMESKQANLINDIKNLKKIQAKTSNYDIPHNCPLFMKTIKTESYLTINP